MVERGTNLSDKLLLPRGGIIRQDFGETKLGENTYRQIVKGVTCEALVPKQEQCENLARGTVEFDSHGNTVQIYYCGECVSGDEIRTQVEADCNRQGFNTFPGFNGNGRY